MDTSVVNEIKQRLKASEFWGEKTHESDGYIHQVICPSCRKPRAFIDAEIPGCLICNRENNCGAHHNTFKLFPEIRTNVEKDHPPTPEDPNAPARQYLLVRGLKKSLERLEFEYKQNIAGHGKGGAGFPFVNKNGDTVWNTRVFKPGDGPKTKNQKDAVFAGAFWQHPGIEYDRGRETFLVEGVIEALSLIEMGFQAIALPSVKAKPAGYDFEKFPNVVLAFNNDLAGWEALSSWRKHNREFEAILPTGRGDWNDFIIQHGANAAEEFTSRRGEFEANCDGIEGKIADAKMWKKINREIEEISKNYAVIMWGGKFRVMKEFIEPNHNRPDLELQSKDDFNSFFANRLVENPYKGKGQNKFVSIASLWLKAENKTDPKTGKQTGRRQYNGIVFKPPKKDGDVNTEGYYNLWRGFAIEPKEGPCDLYIKHVWENIVKKDDALFKWLMAWLARIVQEPGGARPGTSVAMLGQQGTGKGTVVKPFEMFFGGHFLHLRNQTHLTGRFNGHLKNAIVVFADESFWGGDRSAEGALKGIITESSIPVEDKGEKLVTVENFVNLFIASNNDWGIPAGLEERRFFVVETSDKHRQSKEYFGPIVKQLESGGYAGLLHYLLNLDISGVNLRKAPKTQALLAQIEHSMDPLTKWWYACLIDGQNDKTCDEWQLFVETETLYNAFKHYTQGYRQNGYIPPDSQFARKIKGLIPGIEPFRPHAGKRGYNFPDLNLCRKSFENRIDMEIDWNGI